VKPTKDLIKFDVETAVIVALDNKYKDIQITDAKSRAFVMEGLREYRELRLKVVDGHKEAKQKALEHCNFLDAERQRILARLAPGENYLKEVRQADDDRKAKIKAEKEAEERERIQTIQDKINSIRTLGIVHGGASSTIQDRLTLTKGIEPSKEVYQEFLNQAMDAQMTAITSLEEALSERLQFEKEQVARKAEAERLEKVRKEQEATQAKIDEENRKIEEEKAKIESEKKAEAERREREEFERQAKLRAETYAKEKAEQAERNRIEKEQAEAKEKARQEALRPDKEKLIKFADELVDIGMPDIKSAEGRKILFDADDRRHELAEDIKEQAQKL